MSSLVHPPASDLPPGATAWALVNNVAMRTGKKVRTIESWCEKGLLHSITLAGGYGGVWVAIRADGWPVDGPNVKGYQDKRSDSARARASKLADSRTRAAAPASGPARRSKRSA